MASPVKRAHPHVAIGAIPLRSGAIAGAGLGADEARLKSFKPPSSFFCRQSLPSRADTLLILDDQLARKIAKFYQLRYTGTLGVLIKAKQSGYLEAIALVIINLKKQGMWLTNENITTALKLAGKYTGS